MNYPKRLIEVDLPIKRISASAQQRNRAGGLNALHVWWARKPQGAVRAVLCASLWPDPADPNCPQAFRDAAAKIILEFARATQSNRWGAEVCDNGSFARYMRLAHGGGSNGGGIDPSKPKDLTRLRALLLDFVADFAAWEASTNSWFLDTARSLTQAAHEALGGEKGSRPLVVDPFAGGGAIPFEAGRLGAVAYASDISLPSTLLSKIVLEVLPKYGQKLVDRLRHHVAEISAALAAATLELYPSSSDGEVPYAFIWSRTVQCEGPACGAVIPLRSTMWLAQRRSDSLGLRFRSVQSSPPRIDITLGPISPQEAEGNVRRGSVTCPACGFTTPVTNVRRQLRDRRGGTSDARLVAVVVRQLKSGRRYYRLPTAADSEAVATSRQRYAAMLGERLDGRSLLPREATPPPTAHRSVVSPSLYGILEWHQFFHPRQAVVHGELTKAIRRVCKSDDDLDLSCALALAAILDRCLQYNSSGCRWKSSGESYVDMFGHHAFPFGWDFAEIAPIGDHAGSFDSLANAVVTALQSMCATTCHPGSAVAASATDIPLPDECSAAVVTDPPYYDAVAYGALLSYFTPWIERAVPHLQAALLQPTTQLQACEIVVNKPNSDEERRVFLEMMASAMVECARITSAHGVAVVIFAHKSTSGWESQLDAMLRAGWMITASWPVHTELASRLNAANTASLLSSIHLVCRHRPSHAGIGDWRDVLAELPVRTREWMARLGSEGVVGADAIFACLGPALEIFSRYSRVEKASGEPVLLKEYLTYVWGAVAQEALAQIFKDADASGFEEDARLTAMWLWTLNAGAVVPTDGAEAVPDADEAVAADDTDGEEDEEEGGGKKKSGGYVLEFDAARKIAQGLGAHLEQLAGVIEVKGDKARLLGVAERTRRLFGKDEADAPGNGKAGGKRKKKNQQMSLFAPEDLGQLEADAGGWGEKSVPALGATTLDRVHQSMILFAAGRGEALRRFLVEDGAGRDGRFWKLANALSALYPAGTNEKRWVDGVLARKKGLGL
jgi:adenine-specific DNA methylase